MNNFDVIIVGAGIIGLSTAYKISEKNPGLKICILEKENDICRHQTGNNSGVIHSGIYYKPGSLKSQNCFRGYKMLLDFCDMHNIRYEICGKIIIAASNKELQGLQNLYERGIKNGLKNLKFLSREEIKEIEPYANGIKGILVPQTGIIDFVEVSRKIENLIKEKGGEIWFNEKVISIKDNHGCVKINTERNSYSAGKCVTCAGLHSDRLAKLTNKNIDIKIIPFRGEYYKIKEHKRNIIRNLIYPVPDPEFPFLGVHYTRRIDGLVEAGPNAVFAFKREGYKKSDISVKDLADSLFWKGFVKIAFRYWKMGMKEFYRSYSKSAFVRSLQKLTPEIKKDDLETGGAGVRAQACNGSGKLIDDFLFIESKNVIHVCNAPSPAATSSFSIGQSICDKVINL